MKFPSRHDTIEVKVPALPPRCVGHTLAKRAMIPRMDWRYLRTSKKSVSNQNTNLHVHSFTSVSIQLLNPHTSKSLKHASLHHLCCRHRRCCRPHDQRCHRSFDAPTDIDTIVQEIRASDFILVLKETFPCDSSTGSLAAALVSSGLS